MPFRRSNLRLVPPAASPAADPLHVVHAEPAGQTGWLHVEVWRRGDLVAIGDARSEEITLDFLKGLAAFWLGDPGAVLFHATEERTGT